MSEHGIITGKALRPDDVSFDVADRLRKAREMAGYEQGELAKMIDVSRTTVGNYEHRHVRPVRNTVKLWAMATGVPYTWIMTGVWPDDSRGDTGTVMGAGARSSTDRASDYGSLVRQIRGPRHADPPGDNPGIPA